MREYFLSETFSMNEDRSHEQQTARIMLADGGVVVVVSVPCNETKKKSWTKKKRPQRSDDD
jgi:hypothetical protein